MTSSFDGKVIGDRFGLSRAPTILARAASVAPIGFSRLHSSQRGDVRAKPAPPEDAFTIHVALQATSTDLWVDDKHVFGAPVEPGASFLFDLNSNPVSELHRPFDILRFYISYQSLDELGVDAGRRRLVAAPSRLGKHDTVLHGLAMSLLDSVERSAERTSLFIDHVALAFHAHVTDRYGVEAVGPARAGSMLAPWQLKRALEFITCNLDSDPTIAELARECGLSPGYFARAFRTTTGMAPHQWLIRRRVARARELLLGDRHELADIAVMCGFVDQSHFTRVFARLQGLSPGRWRMVNARQK